MSDTQTYRPVIEKQTRVLCIRGVEYCINEWGDEHAPLLFYLHGWADTGSTFQFVVDALENDWRVIAPDWRGFGRTLAAGESYWFPDYLADLHSLLDIYSPDAAVQLLGHSMGANVASLYAGTMPERVKTLVNIEGFGLSDSDPGDAPDRYREWIEASLAKPAFVHYSNFDSLATRVKKRSPGLSDVKAGFIAREWARESDDGSIRLRADAAHKLPNPVLYRRAESVACWQNIRAAILLVYGDKSPFAAQFGHITSLPFPDAQSFGIEGAGHMLHFEAPEQLARQIEAFLLKPL